jgi:hypothetical protein
LPERVKAASRFHIFWILFPLQGRSIPQAAFQTSLSQDNIKKAVMQYTGTGKFKFLVPNKVFVYND